MKSAVLAHEADFDGWRRAARALKLAGVPPEQAIFAVAGQAQDLFDDPAEAAPSTTTQFTVPRGFMELAQAVICHSDPGRFGLLYTLLWRVAAQPGLLEDAADREMLQARTMEKNVRRDAHKMTAFVRFREVADEQGPIFVSWFEPSHFIEERVSRFFVDRYASQRFAILTPRLTMGWDGAELAYGPPGTRADVPEHDGFSESWNTYYRSTFNPARLRLNAMRSEMPKKYWRNLPETHDMASMISAAAPRTEADLAREPSEPPERHVRQVKRRDTLPAPAADAPPATSLEGLRDQAAGCRRCPLWEPATGTVFGEGPAGANFMFVGEQPGDNEDLQGRPFVGPAGKVFDKALAEAGIARERVYITNAVKHFKFEPRGKFRLHKKPNAGEITACRWWLDSERALVKPTIVVALGATALQALLGRATPVAAMRGRRHVLDDGSVLLTTVHPSYLLRLPDPAIRVLEEQQFVADLRGAASLLQEMEARAAVQNGGRTATSHRLGAS